MRIIDKGESAKTEFHDAVMKGAVFVYPTDTIYGIGCNALDGKATARIRQLKDRSTAPFSVIAPSKEWIRQNCEMTKEAEAWLAKLPGPYTLIMRMKRGCVAGEVAQGTLGVRIPAHWISGTVAKLGVPVVTTSVNKSGREPMTSAEDIDPDIKAGVDFLIDDGARRGKPSTIVDLTDEKTTIKER